MEIDFTPLPEPTAALRRTVPGSRSAVLFLHGITGSPAAWTPIASAVADSGVSVSVPLLPGHGTSWQELARTSWRDWRSAAADEFAALSAEHDRVVVAGLSMGGALALALAADAAPAAGLVLVNPALFVDSPLTPMLPVLRHLVGSVEAIGGDIAHPGRDEFAYARTPVAAIASFASALRGLRQDLWQVEAPVALCISGDDAVVGPRSLRLLRARLPRSPEILALRHSKHVATLDHDADRIAATVLARAQA